MYLLDFIFENNTLKTVIGSLLGYDITDDNTSDAELLDEIITNVFNNHNELVSIIVALFSDYTVNQLVSVELVEIIEDKHFDFYEDAGYDTHEEVLDHNANLGPNEERVTEISRVKTSATIDNLDALVGKILNLSLLKDPLTKEGEGAFNKLFGLTSDDTITLKAIVDAVFETYLYDDKGLNSIMDMLIGLLGGEGSAQIINIVLDILSGAGYDLTPYSFYNNVASLRETIAKAVKNVTFTSDDYESGNLTEEQKEALKALKWSDVVKANSKYQYVVKNDEGEVVETLFSDTKADTDNKNKEYTIDEKTAVADWVQKQIERKVEKDVPVEGTDTTEKKKVTEYKYIYSVKNADDELVDTELWLEEAGKTEWIETVDNPETEDVNEEVKHLVEAVMEDTDKQKTAVKISATWGLKTPDDFVNMLWNCIKPLAPIFAALFCEGDLTIFEKITIKGSKGYEGFVLPLINALGIPALRANKDADGNWTDDLTTANENEGPYFLESTVSYADYKAAVYNDDGTIDYDGAKIMLTTITDALFALVDSLCARPVNTILTIIPYLVRFIESNGVDAILNNLLVPVTTITGMIENIYKIDLLGMVKDLLRGIIKDMNDKAGETSDSTDPAAQATTGGAAAAYLLDVIDEADGDGRTAAEAAVSELVDPALDLSGGDSSNYTFKDIIEELLAGVSINGTALSSIINPEFIFLDLASIAWPAGKQKVTVTINSDRRGGSYSLSDATAYTVDRESVLIKVLNDIVFTPGIRDLIGGLLKFDFSKETMTTLKAEDSNYLLTVLLYGVFEDPEALERLLVDLLSWYEIEYEDARVSKKNFEDTNADGLNTTNPIDYEAAGLDKAQMEKLPADFDSLIGKIVPAVLGMLPADALGDIKLQGANLEEMVHNLLADLMMDKEVENEDGTKSMKYGFATQLVELLVNLLGGNATVSMIVGLLPTIIEGVDVELKDFKKVNAAFNTYFADYDTWAEAYEGLKTIKKYVEPTEKPDDYKAPLMDADKQLYAVDSEGKPIPEYALDENNATIPVYANGSKVTAFGYEWYTSAGTPANEEEEPLENTYVVKTDDKGGIVFTYQYELKLTNTGSFGVDSYEDVLELVSQILAPFAPVLRFLLTEADLVALDGVHIIGGDGYDRFIIPLFEVLGVDEYMNGTNTGYKGTAKFINKTQFAALDNAQFTAQVVAYIDALISMIVNTPVQTIVDLVPELVFFIYSDGLAQAVEQFVAPLLTLVDMVNDITAKEIAIEGREDKLVALDIVGLITDLINNNLMKPNNIAEVDGFYGDNGLITRLLTADGLEKLLQGLLDNANKWRFAYEYTITKDMVEGATEDEVVTVYFDSEELDGATHIPTNGNGKDKVFKLKAVPEKNKEIMTFGLDKDNNDVVDDKQIIGIFRWILEKTCTIEKVDTIRVFGAENGKVWGINANRADTLVQIISETLLGGDMLTTLLGSFGVVIKEGDIIDTILKALTGENRYQLFVVLLTYFNNYDVETMLMDYLSFEKVEYAYETYIEGTKLTQRKLRRAIKKLDGSILTVVPELIPMLEEVELIKTLLEKVNKPVQSLKDLVHELLVAYAFNDQTMNQLMGLLIGLLGGENLEGTLSTVLPLVKDIVGVDVTPYGFMENTSSSEIAQYLEAAIDVAKNEKVLDDKGEVVLDEEGNEVLKGEEAVTWTDIAEFYTVYVYSYNDVTETVKHKYSYIKDGETEFYYVEEELDDANLVLKEGENTYELTYVGEESFYSYTTNYMYSKDADLHGTAVEGKDGKTWFGYEQATDEDGNLLWDENDGEAKGIPAIKTVKKTVNKVDAEGNNIIVDDVIQTEEIDVEVRATRVNALDGDAAFNWGIDDANGYEAKADAFVEILAGIVTPLEGILNFLLRGDSLYILPNDDTANSGVLEFKGNNGYENVIMPLFQALAVDQVGGTIVSADEYEAGRGKAITLTAITDGIFAIIEALTNGPLEYIFTLLPSLSYFISCNGPEIVLNNLLSPVLALLNLADPIVGDLLDDLLGATLSNIFGAYMPDDIQGVETTNYKSPVYKEVDGTGEFEGQKVKVQATDNGQTIKFRDETYYITAGDGELIEGKYVVETETVDNVIVPKFNKYDAYALTDLLKICGENGDNLVKIINSLVGPLLVKDNEATAEDEVAAFKLLPETFFADYAAHAITINKQNANARFYYTYLVSDKGTPDDKTDDEYATIEAKYYDKETMGPIDNTKTRYVVEWFKADIADSAVYLLDNVLSESLLKEIAKLAKVDLEDETNILGGILNNLIEGNFNGLAVADLITALFENYTITYNELYGEYIEPDHSHLDVLDSQADKDKAAAVPGKLDNIIKEALPAIAPILSKLLAPKDGKEPTILNDIFDNFDDIVDTEDTVADLYEVVEYLLDDLVWSDELVNTLAALIINLIGGNEIVGTIINYFGLTGIKLDPQSYLATVKKAYGESDTAVVALAGIIGNAETWADVVKNDATPLYAYEYIDGKNDDGTDKKYTVYLADENATTYELTKTEGEGEEAKEVKYNVALTAVKNDKDERIVKAEFNNVVDGKNVAEVEWGVNDSSNQKDAFIKALSVIIEPLFPVLQLVLQGKTLTLIGHDKSGYTPVNMIEYKNDGTMTYIVDAAELDTVEINGKTYNYDADSKKFVNTADANDTIEAVFDNSRNGKEIGNGYIELVGVNGYEELLVPILDSIGGIDEFGRYADDNKTGIMTAEQFGNIDTAYGMLSYIVNVVFAFVNKLVASPVTYLAENLPTQK